MSEKIKLRTSIKHPTSIIVQADNLLGYEIVKSLIEQGGYVIIIDSNTEKLWERYKEFEDHKLLSIIDFSAIEYLDDDLRRLDYVFYLLNDYQKSLKPISSQEFLQECNYLDLIINLAAKYNAKFLLNTSIKAHQVLASGGDMEYEFGQKNNDVHAVYTQLEVQRYSEALVRESIEKFNLDARIVRMGRVLGPGMQFDLDESVDKFVYEIVTNKDLEIGGDGLETNNYVHVLDGAYGVIKAMFSKDTTGKIYSVANEEEVTDLSIAYKLIELTGSVREIRFVDSKDSIPPLRFYKPAPSLSEKGWSPRIGFTRTLQQVLDYAYSFYLEKPADDAQEEVIEEITPSEALDTEPQGALARLIAERKAQERARRGSILLANNKLREKSKARRQFTRSERIQRYVNKRYDSYSSKLGFLKRVTVVEAFFYLILFMIFLGIYLSFISPAFVIGRSIAESEFYQDQIGDDYEGLYKIRDSLTSMEESFSGFEIVYSAIGQGERYEDTMNSLRSLSLYTKSTADGAKLAENFDDYLAQNSSELIYRPNADSLIAVSDSGEANPLLTTIKANRIQFSQAREKIQATSDFLSASEEIKIFGFDLTPLRTKILEESTSIQEILNFANIYQMLFITENTQTYAFIVQDNARYTPGGGYPAAVGFIQYNNGKITNIRFESYKSDFAIDRAEISSSELEEMRLASDSFLTTNEVGFEDLFLVKDRAKILDNIKGSYKEEYGVEVNTVFFMDLESMAKLMDYTGQMELNQVNVDRSNVLSSIELLSAENKTIEGRNEIIANLAALIIVNLSEDREVLYDSLNTISEASANKSIWAESTNTQIENTLFGSQPKDKPFDWIQVAASSDPEATDIKVFPTINLTVQDTVNNRYEIVRTVELVPANTQNLERIIVCMPAHAKNFNLSGSRLNLGQAFSSTEICVAGDLDSGRGAKFTYMITPVDNLENAEYNMELGILTTPGIEITYDYEISPLDQMSLIPEQGTVASNQKLISSGTLNQDTFINFKIKK